uniref:Uncharacterized protein n=1 Tax=Arundo donax TaxID=35708 RepID=A0A0A9FA13_ARUDO
MFGEVHSPSSSRPPPSSSSSLDARADAAAASSKNHRSTRCPSWSPAPRPGTSWRRGPCGRSSCTAPPSHASPPRRQASSRRTRASAASTRSSSPCGSSTRDPATAHVLYPLTVSCLGVAGELDRMESAVQEMGRLGLRVDSSTSDAFVRAYTVSSTIPQMEVAYYRLKKTGLLISPATIHAVASAYISHQKYRVHLMSPKVASDWPERR